MNKQIKSESNCISITLPEIGLPIIDLQDKPYKEFLYYVLNTIKLNPEHHDQEQWRCGTSFCFAGFTDIITRYVLDDGNFVLQNKYYDDNDDSLINDHWFKPNIGLNTDILDIDTLACVVLGLNYHQSLSLFNPENSIQDLEDIINEITT